jgi:hypothetical protein
MQKLDRNIGFKKRRKSAKIVEISCDHTIGLRITALNMERVGN